LVDIVDREIAVRAIDGVIQRKTNGMKEAISVTGDLSNPCVTVLRSKGSQIADFFLPFTGNAFVQASQKACIVDPWAGIPGRILFGDTTTVVVVTAWDGTTGGRG
jgi:hypothetical protein